MMPATPLETAARFIAALDCFVLVPRSRAAPRVTLEAVFLFLEAERLSVSRSVLDQLVDLDSLQPQADAGTELVVRVGNDLVADAAKQPCALVFGRVAVVDALTRISGKLANAGERSAVDQKASALLSLAR